MRPINFCDPYMITIINKPKTKDELKKLYLGLKRLAEEDLNFLIYTNKTSKQTIIAGKGEQHLYSIVERLKNEFHIDIVAQEPQVLYKETITKTVVSEGRFVRQASSIGRYGHCWIELEPQSRGIGHEFVNKIANDDVIPSEYVPSINEGILRAMTCGILGNFPTVDVKVSLFNGSFHSGDSNPSSYKMAGMIAFKNGIKQADPVLLEPIMNVTIDVEEREMLEVIDDIPLLREVERALTLSEDKLLWSVNVPLREITNLTEKLNFKLWEKEKLTVEFGYYDEVPASLQEMIIDQSSFRDASYTDLFFGGRWGKENEDSYLNKLVDSFWE